MGPTSVVRCIWKKTTKTKKTNYADEENEGTEGDEALPASGPMHLTVFSQTLNEQITPVNKKRNKSGWDPHRSSNNGKEECPA